MRALLCFTLLAFACSESADRREPEEVTEEAPEREPTGEREPDEEPEERQAPVARTFEPAPDGATMIEPAIGQWVRYGVTWREGGRSTTEYRFVDRQNDSWWFEVTDRRGDRQNHVRMRVRPTDDGPEILALSFHKHRERREDVPDRLLPTYQPMLSQWLQMLFPGPLTGEPEAVTVQAGTFPDARKSEETVEFGGQQLDAEVWRHPAVPVTGMVKFRDRNGGHTIELLGFGLEGARSAF